MFARPCAAGGECSLPELLCFIYNLALDFFIAASLVGAHGKPVTEVIYAVGHNWCRMGSPGGAECPCPAGITWGEDGIGVSWALPFTSRSRAASCATASGLGIRKGWGCGLSGGGVWVIMSLCCLYVPTSIAGDGRDDAGRGECVELGEHPMPGEHGHAAGRAALPPDPLRCTCTVCHG